MGFLFLLVIFRELTIYPQRTTSEQVRQMTHDYVVEKSQYVEHTVRTFFNNITTIEDAKRVGEKFISHMEMFLDLDRAAIVTWSSNEGDDGDYRFAIYDIFRETFARLVVFDETMVRIGGVRWNHLKEVYFFFFIAVTIFLKT